MYLQLTAQNKIIEKEADNVKKYFPLPTSFILPFNSFVNCGNTMNEVFQITD